MDRALELDVTSELLGLMEQPTMSLVDEVSELPASDYTDPVLWTKEKERIFKDVPLLAGLSGELAETGQWKTFDAAGTPIMLVRGADGVVRGFLNACRHRGAPIIEEARGSVRSGFTCPYHSWVYNLHGELVGMPHPKTFRGICKQDRGLRQISVQEAAGAIWVLPRSSGEPIDVGRHLGPLAPELELWNLAGLHFVEQREHRIRANWKLAMDTFTEAYHIGNLHKYSIGMFAMGGLNTTTRYGDHFRQVLAMKPLYELSAEPRERWRPFENGGLGFVYVLFPNTTLLFFGDHAELFQVFPADTVDQSVTLQTMFDYEPIYSDDRRAALSTVFDFFYNLVATEDYRMATGIQRALRSGADDTFLLGRCEAITQMMHERYRQLRQSAPGTPWTPVPADRAIPLTPAVHADGR